MWMPVPVFLYRIQILLIFWPRVASNYRSSSSLWSLSVVRLCKIAWEEKRSQIVCISFHSPWEGEVTSSIGQASSSCCYSYMGWGLQNLFTSTRFENHNASSRSKFIITNRWHTSSTTTRSIVVVITIINTILRSDEKVTTISYAIWWQSWSWRDVLYGNITITLSTYESCRFCPDSVSTTSFGWTFDSNYESTTTTTVSIIRKTKKKI